MMVMAGFLSMFSYLLIPGLLFLVGAVFAWWGKQ